MLPARIDSSAPSPFTILRATEYSRYICDNLLLEKLSVFQWQNNCQGSKNKPIGEILLHSQNEIH